MSSSATSSANDPYLWLEEVEGEKALDWVRAQNDRSLNELEASERYATFFDDAKEILTSEDRIPSVSLRGAFAYNFWQDETHIRGLWRRMSIADYVKGEEAWELLLDIDQLANEEQENWVFKGASCLAPDYTRCILTLSRGGSDAAVRREFDLSTKTFLGEGFTLEEAKSSTTWLDKNTLLVGMDLGEETLTTSGYPRQIRLWQRGIEIENAPVVFEAAKEDMGVWPFSTYEDQEYISGFSHALNFYEFDHYLRDEDGMFKKLPLPKRTDFVGYIDGQAIIKLNEDWRRGATNFVSGSVLSLAMDTKGVTLVFQPESHMAVKGVSTTENRIFVELLDNISGRLIEYKWQEDKWQQADIALPQNGVLSIGAANHETDDLLVYYENPTSPETLYYVQKGEAPTAIKSTPAFFDAEGVVTQQYEAVSQDGTRIPYFVMGRKDVLAAGPAPTIQYAYGGFEISILPQYSATTGRLWLEQGGIYVIANIRGGGEFGPSWHQAGLKTQRQKIYDDFFAVSEALIEKKITTPEQLGILGGSNGGLLMGVALTQRPELYKAVGIGVPLLDMLRFHLLLAGASWMGEYGNPEVDEERAFLEKISPYHNLRKTGVYPRPFFFTSTKDDRVHPGHARKMAKQMETYELPFLYYENIEGGHGAAANQNQLAQRLALQFSYFAEELGLKGD
ncbi:MAG: prolyl oligopeptidase family serine peptidase [Pseudomonadota bacterium]